MDVLPSAKTRRLSRTSIPSALAFFHCDSQHRCLRRQIVNQWWMSKAMSPSIERHYENLVV
jgi:hypothetical protein